MNFPELAVLGVLVVLLLIAVGLLGSRSLTEYMVKRGILPQMFLELIPLMMIVGRLVALAMILIGLARFLAVSGLLSGEWIGRYGLASLLVLLGLALLGVSFRERRR